MSRIIPPMTIANPENVQYTGYEILDVKSDEVLSAAEYIHIERSTRIIDTDGTIYEMDGSLSEDQDLEL